MYGFLCFWAFVGLVQGGFFDLTDVDDPFAFLWHIKPIKDKLPNCVIGDVSGVCMEKSKCLLAGGTITKKTCGPFLTCCSLENKCHEISDKKQGYFVSGNLNSATTTCQYTITLRKKNVCQVRLDFEELILAPTSLGTKVDDNVWFLECVHDELRIEPSTYGVPHVCGNSTKQHLYIHVNQSSDPISAVNIFIRLASRVNPVNDHLPGPKWKIKFTQLECPLKRHKFDIFKYGDIENINNDFYALAPQGAVQYFTELSGEFWSFGMSNPDTKNHPTGYPREEHYTIAFRRPSRASCIMFSPTKINLIHDGTKVVQCHDYLDIPEYQQAPGGSVGSNESPTSNAICTDGGQFYSLVPGPFFVNFRANSTVSQMPDPTWGFIISYEVLFTTCP